MNKSKWQGRSLNNYKEQHQKQASNKGVAKEFNEAKTLTQAKKILFGDKPKRAAQREQAYRDWRTKGAAGPSPLKAYTRSGR